MNTQTIVLPSARAIRHEQLQLRETSLFLPNYITMGDFISKLCLVSEYRFIDDDSRVLLLLEASDFDGFSNLQIERNFFTFVKNSSYIFKFFSELSAELYDIAELQLADLYGEYEEHISILIELYKRYKKLCDERKYLDKIFLPDVYEFNVGYASSHEKIILKLNGHLTNFEIELLQKCSEVTEVEILFTSSKFNSKMQSKLLDLGFELEIDYQYRLSLNTKEILDKEIITQNKNITCSSFSESLLQVAFVKSKIYEFIKKGYKAENIAVVLPSEGKAQILRSFDEKSNLNFAMGEPFRNARLYRELHAIIEVIDTNSKENIARKERVGDTLYEKVQNIFYKENHEVDFILFLEEIKESFANKREIKIYEEEIFSFKKLLPFMKDMRVKSLLNLFMQRLASRSLDDIRGGKVTVLGVLETRSVEFDGVIIIDFDDKNVPKKSDKDMFLNSQVREVAGLPTMSDRENLQKHYYNMLINSSKEVAISYVSSEQSSGSRFLKQLNIQVQNLHQESDYAEILFKKEINQEYRFVDREIEYSFKDIKLSSTRLKTYLTCKRKYFHKYIQHLQNHTIPKDMPQEFEIGNSVHLALKELYSNQNSYDDAYLLKKDLDKELDNVCGKSELDEYLIAMQKRRLEVFAKNEIKRFTDGWEVAHTEEFFETQHKGMLLIGQIDRVDKRNDDVEVLDYKTGSYTLYNKNNFTDSTDFQLEFYYLLTQSLGNVTACGFYDLKESKIVPEAFLQEKLEILGSHIKDLLSVESIDTKMCEDEKNCLYCEYKIMCGRE
jgi:inactivated superfamily I helicase/RecB family exonuclease